MELKTGLPETELFIGIEKRYRNEGHATEAVNALTDWAFSTFEIPFLCATILVENGASQRVFERCGYTLISTVELDYPEPGTSFKYYRRQSPPTSIGDCFVAALAAGDSGP